MAVSSWCLPQSLPKPPASVATPVDRRLANKSIMCEATASNFAKVPRDPPRGGRRGGGGSHGPLGHGNQVRFVISKLSGSTLLPGTPLIELFVMTKDPGRSVPESTSAEVLWGRGGPRPSVPVARPTGGASASLGGKKVSSQEPSEARLQSSGWTFQGIGNVPYLE